MEFSLDACEMRRVQPQVNSNSRSISPFGTIILRIFADMAIAYELFIIYRTGSYRYSGVATEPVRYDDNATLTRFPVVHHRAADFERMTR
ncbi:hypothetical protein [Sphingomonas hankookensis]|uniref:hypothetical protein n=1 Tax=Sphingomonas hankookensis TaxID=563996 RepID=UPI003F79E6BB